MNPGLDFWELPGISGAPVVRSWPLVTCTALELSSAASLNHLVTSVRLRSTTTVPPVYIKHSSYPGGLATRSICPI